MIKNKMKPSDKNGYFPIKKLPFIATICLLFSLLGVPISLFAQLEMIESWDIDFFDQNGDKWEMPLVGGLNAPQLSAADFNNDGIDDLYIFDRVGNKHLTFINDGITGQSSYRYAPAYAKGFPRAINWVLLRDFDGDGIVDLFTFPNVQVSGVMVYQGFYEEDQLSFRLIEFDRPLNVLYFSPSSGSDLPIFISNIDYPAIDDMDCDGDLDILTFNSTGGYVELYENQSVERGFGRDTLIFSLRERCWGGLFESGVSNEVDLAGSPGDCFTPLVGEEPIIVRHTGSTLLTFDPDGDGDRDLILGDVSFNALNFLRNDGDCQEAWAGFQDPNFPTGGESVDLPIFPAAFHLDINNDGQEEIMVAPNVDEGGENKEVLWQYGKGAGEGAATYGRIRTDWLVRDMIDVGENSFPCFVDYNQDGRVDILVGNGSFYEPFGAKNARVSLFENIGTAESPAFQQTLDDVFQLNQFSQAATHFAPTFGDLDGDQDLDALIGEVNGQLFYAENTAGPGQPMTFGAVQYGYMGINVGFYARPQLVDVNDDGLLDILIGEQSGNINYFQNQGTKTAASFAADPSTAPNIMVFGGVVAPTDGLAFSGYSSPFLTLVDEEWQLFVGNRIGTVERYGNIEGNLSGDFELLGELAGIDEGAESTICLADINQDELLDLVIGNQRGGFNLLKTPYAPFLNVSNNENVRSQSIQWTLIPNPVRGQAELSIQQEGLSQWQLDIYTADGRRLGHEEGREPRETIQFGTYPPGVYFIRLMLDNRLSTKKVLVLE